MKIRVVTDAEYIRQLNKVQFATPQWLKLQLKYRPLDEVHGMLKNYFDSSKYRSEREDPRQYYDSHPLRRTWVRMIKLIPTTIAFYGDFPENQWIVDKCRQLKVMQALDPADMQDLPEDEKWG